MEEVISRASSVGSNTSADSFNSRVIIEELDEIEETKVYVAVGKEVEAWKENLDWLMKSIEKNVLIVFLHVHQPAQRIAMPLVYMPADKLEEQELNAFRQLEKTKMNKCLKNFVDKCTQENFKATTLSIDNDDIANGLLELIKQHNVTDLVMGAGSERNFFFIPTSKAKERKPRSKIAKNVREKADLICRIRFVSKGELICIREPFQNASDASSLSRRISGSPSAHSNHLRSQFMSPSQAEPTVGPSGLDQSSSPVNVAADASFQTGFSHNGYHGGIENLHAQRSSGSSQQNLFSEVDSLIPDSLTETPLNNSLSSFRNATDDSFTRLNEALEETEKLKWEVCEESSRRKKAELDLHQAKRKLKTMKNRLNVEIQNKADIEGKFVTKCEELEKYKIMYEQVQNELLKTKDLQAKFEETSALLEKTERERDVTLKEIQELNTRGSPSCYLLNCTKFTYSEIKEATRNFDPSHIIGKGGFGAVYKGFLWHTTVATKILNCDLNKGDPQFYQEIKVLSQIRHPYLVTLIGACLEGRVLVYEYLPRGSLDNHLPYKNCNQSLPWQVRVQVAREICSALIFLHSSCVVHGDLNPENVLLDSNFMVKLSDFGICRHVKMTNTTTTPYHRTEQPKGTPAYIDPEYMNSGELTAQCDVFSFGIVLLQLATGKEAMRLKKDVEGLRLQKQGDK